MTNIWFMQNFNKNINYGMLLSLQNILKFQKPNVHFRTYHYIKLLVSEAVNLFENMRILKKLRFWEQNISQMLLFYLSIFLQWQNHLPTKFHIDNVASDWENYFLGSKSLKWWNSSARRDFNERDISDYALLLARWS